MSRILSIAFTLTVLYQIIYVNAAVNRNEYEGTVSDHSSPSAGSGSYPSTGGASQGNLYYYYYPVQDKSKDAPYQASSSNQYASAVDASGTAAGSDSGHSGIGSSSGSGSDLSYSTQDLPYSAQSLGQQLGQGISEYSAQGSNYDQLSNIASQLQQYASANPSAFGSYPGSGSSYTAGGSYPLQADSSSTSYGTSASSPAGSGGFPSSADTNNPYGPSASVPSFAANSEGNFVAPAAAYGQGRPGYQGYVAQPGYGGYPTASNHAPAYENSAVGTRKYGIGSFIMPMLALAGLSLLIPTVSSLSTAAGRKRRSADPAKESAFGSYLDRIERYYTLYKTAVEREECMNRIICELGDAMSNVKGKSTLFTYADDLHRIIEKVVPTWMGNKVGVLKNGALSPDYGKCKKYTCQKR